MERVRIGARRRARLRARRGNEHYSARPTGRRGSPLERDMFPKTYGVEGLVGLERLHFNHHERARARRRKRLKVAGLVVWIASMTGVAMGIPGANPAGLLSDVAAGRKPAAAPAGAFGGGSISVANGVSDPLNLGGRSGGSRKAGLRRLAELAGGSTGRTFPSFGDRRRLTNTRALRKALNAVHVRLLHRERHHHQHSNRPPAGGSAVAPAPQPAPPPPPPAPSGSITGIIYAAADEFGLDRSYLVSVARCESGLNPNAENPAGYHGLFQFDDSTWAAYGYGSIYDPRAQARTAAKLLAAGQASRWPNCA